MIRISVKHPFREVIEHSSILLFKSVKIEQRVSRIVQ